VETQALFDELRLEGCDEVQGYLFSAPVPRSEIPGLIERLDNGEPMIKAQTGPRPARLPAA
jgi:EAL domain-containing protein (putative c-di-GMP-specific phosphodiesterase class I)